MPVTVSPDRLEPRATRPVGPDWINALSRRVVPVLFEDGLHDQRILTGVVVVPASPPHDPEAEGLVQRAGLDVARPDLEDHEPHRAPPGVVEHRAQETPADTAPASRWMHGDVGAVHLISDLPDADIPDVAVLLPHHITVRHPVLFDLVEKGPPGPGHGERGALNGEHLVEIDRSHPLY